MTRLSPHMEKLSITKTETTPKILFDPKNDVFEISGCSITDNPVAYYQPIVGWIKNYAREANAQTPIAIKLEYFNTSSAKALLDVLSAWATVKNVRVVWYHHPDEDDIKQAGEEFSELVPIPFEFKTY